MLDLENAVLVEKLPDAAALLQRLAHDRFLAADLFCGRDDLFNDSCGQHQNAVDIAEDPVSRRDIDPADPHGRAEVGDLPAHRGAKRRMKHAEYREAELQDLSGVAQSPVD